VIDAIRRFLRVLREGPVPVPCRIERLESERGFRLSGDLDVYSVEAVREALGPELHGTLVLDIAAVEFMDDSGLGLLVGSVKRLREQDGSLVLRNPTGQIRRVLEVTGLEQVPGLTIEPDGGSS
jgi:anti-sigma B factor antagonist